MQGGLQHKEYAPSVRFKPQVNPVPLSVPINVPSGGI